MAPEKQVSPAIRISQEERDVSARATHLEAVIRKFLVTTSERKQMSNKTNFKRMSLAVVAFVAAGLLTSITPAQATITSPTVSATAGSATTTTVDSTTAAVVTVTALMDQAASPDTISVSITNAIGNTKRAYMVLKDTAVGTSTVVDSLLANQNSGGGLAINNAKTLRFLNSATESATSVIATAGASANLGAQLTMALDTTAGSVGYVSARFNVFLESNPVGVDAGTYNYTVVVKTYDNGILNAAKTVTTTATVTVAALAANSKTVDPGQSSAVLGVTTANFGSSISDSVVSAVSTGSGSTIATLRVRLRNASGGNAQESITATISAGTIGNGTVQGRSVVIPASAGDNDLLIKGDGTNGVANITVKSGVWTMTPKSLTFYASTASKIVATRGANVVGASTTVALLGNEFDASGNDFGSGVDVYAFSSDTSIISNYGTACTYNSTYKAALCTLTGVKNGKAKVTLRDASTVALSTVASDAIEYTVNLNAAASVEIALNKATYAPGEKATVKITVKDSAGGILPAATYSNLFATGG